MKLLVTGGYPKKKHFKQEAGYKYQDAFMLIFDWETGEVKNEMKYRSPPKNRSRDASMLFKMGELHNNEFIVPSSTEILFIDINSLKINRTISLPCFTDLHHVCRMDGIIYIANTGLEKVQLMDDSGAIIKEYSLATSPTWKKYDINTDFRFVGSTKPHETHVNFVFFIDDELWCTRFQHRDAISLSKEHRRIDLNVSDGKPHDGLVIGDFIYFSITDGYIVVVNKYTLKTEEVINLNGISDHGIQLGWCRGVDVFDGNIYVGFSNLRRSKFSEYGSWILHKNKKLPARIAQYNLEKKSIIKEVNIGNKGAAIFTVKCYS